MVARQLGKACVVGCTGLAIDEAAKQAKIAGHVVKEGDWLSIDGESGEVFPGERRIITSRPEAEIAEIARWKRRIAGDLSNTSLPSPVPLKLALATCISRVRIPSGSERGDGVACSERYSGVPSPRGREDRMRGATLELSRAVQNFSRPTRLSSANTGSKSLFRPSRR